MAEKRSYMALGLVVAATLMGCPDYESPSNTVGTPPIHSSLKAKIKVPSKAPTPPAAMRTVEVNPGKAAMGKALFQSCAGCHGAAGEGIIGSGPRLNSETFLAAASDAMLVDTISEGRDGTTMIAWKNMLKPPQVESVVAYIRTLADTPPAKLNEEPLSPATNLADGERVYQSICYTCHGRTGAGYQETANGTGIGRRVFLDKATNGYLRYIIKHGKTGTKMKGFLGPKVSVANLTPQDIENVIGYLRDRAW